MTDILSAYYRGRESGRTGEGLTVLYDHKNEGKLVTVTADVSGGSEPHNCIVTWPVKSSWLVTPLRMKSSQNDARWHCDCQDFRFTFHPFLKSNDEHLLDFPEYIPNGRGSPRAIFEYGMCKHLVALLNVLKKDGKAKF